MTEVAQVLVVSVGEEVSVALPPGPVPHGKADAGWQLDPQMPSIAFEYGTHLINQFHKGSPGIISQDRRGVVSGMLNLSRNLGLVTGTSVMGAVFALASGVIDIMTVPADAVATGMRVTFAVAAILVLAALAISVGSRALATRPSLRLIEDRAVEGGT